MSDKSDRTVFTQAAIDWYKQEFYTSDEEVVLELIFEKVIELEENLRRDRFINRRLYVERKR